MMTNKNQETQGESELRYRRLFETAQDGILILTFPGAKIEDANPFIADLIGYTREELIGKELWEIGFIADIELAKMTATKLSQELYVRYDNLNLRTKDGRSMEVEFVANTYKVNGHSVSQCNIRDITAKRNAERQLAQAVEADT